MSSTRKAFFYKHMWMRFSLILMPLYPVPGFVPGFRTMARTQTICALGEVSALVLVKNPQRLYCPLG